MEKPVNRNSLFLSPGIKCPVFVRKELSAVLEDHPEYEKEVYLLSVLPLEKMAEKERKKMMGKDRGFFLNPKILFPVYQKITEKTEEIIESLPLTEKSVLCCVHLEGRNVSDYILRHYYRKSVLVFCERAKDKLKPYYEILAREMEDLWEEKKIILYDMETLFILADSERTRKKGDKGARDFLLQISPVLLKMDLPLSKTYLSFSEYLKGNSLEKIGRMLFLDSRTVQKEITKGKRILSIILWGYLEKGSPFREER